MYKGEDDYHLVRHHKSNNGAVLCFEWKSDFRLITPKILPKTEATNRGKSLVYEREEDHSEKRATGTS